MSDWAAEHTPIFGSRGNAYRTSDTLNDVGGAVALLTALATPSGETAGDILMAKAKGIAVEFVSVGATQTATANLKNLTGRTRPDRSDDQSFPSAHSSKAFAYASVSRHNLDVIAMPDGLRTGFDLGFTSLAAATAWARIEAKKHYPSDVLAGAALANFTTTFFIDAFLGLEPGDLLSVRIDPEPGGFLARVSLRY